MQLCSSHRHRLALGYVGQGLASVQSNLYLENVKVSVFELTMSLAAWGP